VVDYLKKAGRPVATELRDLELPADAANEVRKLMGE